MSPATARKPKTESKPVKMKATTKKTATKKTSSKDNGKALVIVESPAKSKTIKKILGDNFQIEASFGHVRDFPKNVLGFDVDHDFKPSFIVIPEKKKVVTKLNDLAKKSSKVYLASHPDREGEAIAWHVRELRSEEHTSELQSP